MKTFWAYNMITPNEFFGSVNIVISLICCGIITYMGTVFYKQRFHSLLIKRQSNLTIFSCVVAALAEIFILIPFTLHYTHFSFFLKSVRFYSGLLVFITIPFIFYGGFSAYILRYVIDICNDI